MKHTFLIILVAFSLSLKGQTLVNDSLRKALRSDARWAITHEEYSKGKRILEKLIIEEPNNPDNYFTKTMIYYFQKKSDSLTICLDKALELGRDSMRVFREYYRYYSFQQEDNNKCLDYINKMINLQPNNSDLYMERRSVWLDMHNFDNSWKDLEKAASLGNEQAKNSMKYIIETRKKLKEKGIIK